MGTVDRSVVEHAADRFFRSYHKHCVDPDFDTLLNFFNSTHGLNDKLKRCDLGDFHGLDEFLVIKTLRNYFHHEGELHNEVRLLARSDIPIFTDLMFTCLIKKSSLDSALLNVPDKYRSEVESAVSKVVKNYGLVVDVNPCLFNFAVYVYENVVEVGLSMTSEEFFDFKESYDYESENGYPHFVSGDFSCKAGDIDKVILTFFADLKYPSV